MSNFYKIIEGTSRERLEWLVNEFLKTPESAGFGLVGPPQVFGHEAYTQAFYKQPSHKATKTNEDTLL